MIINTMMPWHLSWHSLLLCNNTHHDGQVRIFLWRTWPQIKDGVLWCCTRWYYADGRWWRLLCEVQTKITIIIILVLLLYVSGWKKTHTQTQSSLQRMHSSKTKNEWIMLSAPGQQNSRETTPFFLASPSSDIILPWEIRRLGSPPPPLCVFGKKKRSQRTYIMWKKCCRAQNYFFRSRVSSTGIRRIFPAPTLELR